MAVKLKPILAKYPKAHGRHSAVMPVLAAVQRDNGGWLDKAALARVAEMLEIPLMRVYEIATFYSMFHLSPVGRYHIQLCHTTTCWLKGSDDLEAVLLRRIGDPGSVSDDGLFSWETVECLGACTDAPVVRINETTHLNMDAQQLETLLDEETHACETG